MAPSKSFLVQEKQAAPTYSNPKALEHREHAERIARHDRPVQQVSLQHERADHAAHEQVRRKVDKLVLATDRQDDQNRRALCTHTYTYKREDHRPTQLLCCEQ